MPYAVLLAEDDESNAIVACAALELYGCVVDVVGDGLAAAQAAQARRYDLIFMDFHMPQMNGLSATAEIRRFENDAGLRRTPIVALTASAMPQERQDCLDAGMDDVLTKPFRFPELLSMLRRWSDGRPA
jgi:CheY-like chemotaxis protein